MSVFLRHGLELPPQIRVFAGFFLYAFGMGGIFPRIGDIQRAMGVTEGTLGFALIGAACGTLVSLTFASRLLERVGYRRVVHTLVPLLPAWYALAAWAPGPMALFLLLVPAGITIGCIEIIVNLEADRVEHQLGRRIMNRAHAFWSFGFFAAGLLGALMSKLGASPQLHLALMVPVVFVATVLLLGRFDPAPHRDAGQGEPQEAPHFARPTGFIMVLVLVTLPAMMLEGAGAEWSAIYMRDVFAATPFISGFAVALGAFTQAVTRFIADAYVERHSPAGVSRVLLGVLGVGALLVFSAWHAWLSLLGFALMGVGTSVIFPLAMSAAAQRTDRPAALNVAALAQTAFVIFMVGPPLLGFVAEHFGIRWSFGIGLPLVGVALLLCGALGSRLSPAAKAA